MLTKDDKSLLGYYAGKIWEWLQTKVATSSSNGMMSATDKQRLDALWRNSQITNNIDGGSESKEPLT